ncbi:MAG: hypothetical protein P4M05_10410 [Bradyrhizobium sp.]|nr:hypothetical protein [Bradyrhizobium sp.]
MPAQNAAARSWDKAAQQHRQEQAREASGQPSGPAKSPERKLSFAEDREGKQRERCSLKHEQSSVESSKDQGSKDGPTKSDSGDRKLNFARDRSQDPDRGR